MTSSAAYAAYVLLALIGFGLAPKRALWPIFFIGLVWLPPIMDPYAWPQEPWRVIGGALPSADPLGKAQVVPLTCLIGALAFNRDYRSFAPLPADGAIAAFCFWPILQGWLLGWDVTPSPVHSAAFLACTWGALWLLGRICLRDREDLQVLAISLCYVTVALLPFIIFEQVTAYRLHEMLFGPHPYANIGQDRWFGNRPLLFFEDGNQYGLWVACAALAAAWLWKADHRPGRCILAAVLLICAFSSQSAGAILLLMGALILLFVGSARRAALYAGPLVITCGLAFGALHLTGIINARELALGNPVGSAVYHGLREIGRGSFGWRIAQDLKTFPAIQDSLLLGTGQWDWFNPAETRPWGLPQLMLGQFGLVALVILGSAAVLAAASIAGVRVNARKLLVMPSLLIAMAGIDSVLNSFLFLPAISLAGACVTVAQSGKLKEALRRGGAPPPSA